MLQPPPARVGTPPSAAARGGEVIRYDAGVLLACLVVLLAGLTGGCARARAAAMEGPPLAVPMPPVHAVVPVEVPVASAGGQTDTPLAGAPEVVQQSETQPAEQTQPTRLKPQPPAASVVPTPQANPPAAELPQQVRIDPSANDAARRKEIEDLITSAEFNLNRVSEQAQLNDRDRVQYTDASSLLAAARKAYHERNFDYAYNQAKKAATIAAALVR